MEIMEVYLSLDCGWVKQEGDLFHGLSITADLPRDVVASNHQMVSGRGICIGDVHWGSTLYEDGRGRP